MLEKIWTCDLKEICWIFVKAAALVVFGQQQGVVDKDFLVLDGSGEKDFFVAGEFVDFDLKLVEIFSDAVNFLGPKVFKQPTNDG